MRERSSRISQKDETVSSRERKKSWNNVCFCYFCVYVFSRMLFLCVFWELYQVCIGEECEGGGNELAEETKPFEG